jgi:hypothetical protein
LVCFGMIPQVRSDVKLAIQGEFKYYLDVIP